MDRKIRVVQYGAGKMSRYHALCHRHDGELVGAFCRNKGHIGKDVSEIIGGGFPHVGVTVENSRRRRQAHQRAQARRLHNRNAKAPLQSSRTFFTICAKHGVNAITTCEEALYPWNSSPAPYRAEARQAHKEGAAARYRCGLL